MKSYIEFPTRTEEDGSTSILVKGCMYIKNAVQPKSGCEMYGDFEGDHCVFTIINDVFVLKKKKKV